MCKIDSLDFSETVLLAQNVLQMNERSIVDTISLKVYDELI